MSSATWQRVEKLFERAVDLPPAERAALLARECGDDAELRHTVEVLLASEEDGDELLRQVVGHGAQLLEAEPAEERRIGPYRLLHRLGVGGMGEVYLAERADREYTKKVALKLVRPGFDTSRLLERFRRERQILANLDHPHIARLLDGGSTAEQAPYFVMEHIEGEPIDRWCDHRRLGVRARLELFRTVCDAVQFAHQNLVVHRDLKPSNILVTEDGTVKLLDFGIAKLLATEDSEVDAELTLTAERPLTLSHASPEQVRGEPITTASDVYALGCLAYQLLAGSLPYELKGKTRRQVEQIVLEEAPLAPSASVARRQRESPEVAETIARSRHTRPEALRRSLRGELDAIVLGALRKKARRRPGSVAELAEDVRLHLAGLPVRAHRDTLGYRAMKFTSRHRLALALVAIFMVVIAGAFLNSLRQAERTARERDKALVVVDLLVEMFAVSDPSRSRGETITARELLDAGARGLDRTLDDQPLRKAMLSDTIGRVYRELGLYGRGRPLVEEALAIRRQHLGESHSDVAQSLNNLGGIEHADGDYEASAARHQEALTIFRLLPGDRRSSIADSLNDLALARHSQGRYQEAEGQLRQALALYRSLGRVEHADYAISAGNLGRVLAEQEEYEEAVELTRQALEIAQRVYGGPHPQVGTFLNNLASQLNELGDETAAEPLFRQALEMRRELLGPEHPDAMQTLNNFAGWVYSVGKYQQAAELFRELIPLARNTLGEEHPEVATYHNNLGVVLKRLGAYEEAEELYAAVLSIRRQSLGEQHPDVIKTLDNLATVKLILGDYAEARRLFEQALELGIEQHGENHSDVATTMDHFARLHLELGDLESAFALQRRGLAIRLAVFEEENRYVATSRARLAAIHAATGDLETAYSMFRQATEEQRRLLSEDHPLLAESLLGMGEVLTALGRPDEAEVALLESLRIRQESLPEGHWKIIETASALGACRGAQGRSDEAGALLRESLTALEAQHGSGHYLTRTARGRLDRFLTGQASGSPPGYSPTHRP